MLEVGLVGLQVEVLSVTNHEGIFIEVAGAATTLGHIIDLNMQIRDGLLQLGDSILTSLAGVLLEVGDPFFKCLEQVGVVSLFLFRLLLATLVRHSADLFPDHADLLLV